MIDSSSFRRSPGFSLAVVIGLLAGVSFAMVRWCAANGYLLYWGDAMAHLNIARRIVDSRTPGYEQIGTVWLPLPHLLMLPFVGDDELWRSGLAGAIPSAVAFVAAGGEEGHGGFRIRGRWADGGCRTAARHWRAVARLAAGRLGNGQRAIRGSPFVVARLPSGCDAELVEKRLDTECPLRAS